MAAWRAHGGPARGGARERGRRTARSSGDAALAHRERDPRPRSPARSFPETSAFLAATLAPAGARFARGRPARLRRSARSTCAAPGSVPHGREPARLPAAARSWPTRPRSARSRPRPRSTPGARRSCGPSSSGARRTPCWCSSRLGGIAAPTAPSGSSSTRLHVMNLAVRPEVRRRGLGRFLLGIALARGGACRSEPGAARGPGGQRGRPRALQRNAASCCSGSGSSTTRDPPEDALVLVREGGPTDRS